MRELWHSLAAVVVVTAVYLAAYRASGTFPTAYGLVGHTIGIIGFVLMLMTETLYSMRKQMTDARWGNMAAWLRFHIVTGFVGPYMVLLHTSMRFRGLAGVATLLTLVVVFSGVVGRYIYTALPRVPEPTDARGDGLARRRKALATWRSIHVPLTWVLFTTAFVHSVAALYFATFMR